MSHDIIALMTHVRQLCRPLLIKRGGGGGIFLFMFFWQLELHLFVFAYQQ